MGCECVRMHLILMRTWSLVKPHYHNFFWGKNTEERVSFIATTAELQAKAGAKNSLKVSCAVNPILCSHTGWKKWKSILFILVFFITIQRLCGLFLLIYSFLII